MSANRSRYFRILVASYIIVLAITLLTGNLDYMLTKSLIEEEVLRSNSAILKQACGYMDNQLNQVKLLATDIELSPRINEFIKVHDAGSGDNQYKIYNIVKEMSAYKNKYPFISDFYIYFKNSNKTITSSASCQSKLFYEEICGFEGMNCEDWQNTILNARSQEIFTLTRRTMRQKPHTAYLTYIRPLPICLARNHEASLVVLIEEKAVRTLQGNLDWLNNGYLYIVDGSGKVITSNNTDTPHIDTAGIHLDGEEGYTVINAGKESMALSYVSSEEHGWKYVSLMPMDLYMGRVSRIREITFVIFLISLFAGMIAVVVFSYRNYLPVRKILGMLPVANGMTKQVKRINEFDFIQNTIARTFEEDRRIHQILENQKPIIRDNMMRRLLEGKTEMVGPSAVESAAFFGLDFPYGLFAAAVFNLERQQAPAGECDESRWEYSKLKVCECLMRIFSDNGIKAFVTDMDSENLVMIVNVDGNSAGEVYDKLQSLSDNAIISIKDAAGIYCTVGIGSIYNSPAGISKSYLEAMRSLDYRMLKGYGPIIKYEEIVEGDLVYYYPMETQRQLANSLKAGELAGAKKIFDYLFEENINKRHLVPDMVRMFFSDVVGTIVKVVINEIKTDYKSVFNENFNPSNCFSDCANAEEIKERFYTIFANLCAFINKNKKSHNTLLLNKIINYIKAEYSNPDLCLQLIASAFGISIPYLSRFFKEQTGENLNNYINNMRVERASELLAGTSMPIADIARRVGFNNNSSFIRVFKKSTGKTPGMYKQECAG